MKELKNVSVGLVKITLVLMKTSRKDETGKKFPTFGRNFYNCLILNAFLDRAGLVNMSIFEHDELTCNK